MAWLYLDDYSLQYALNKCLESPYYKVVIECDYHTTTKEDIIEHLNDLISDKQNSIEQTEINNYNKVNGDDIGFYVIKFYNDSKIIAVMRNNDICLNYCIQHTPRYHLLLLDKNMNISINSKFLDINVFPFELDEVRDKKERMTNWYIKMLKDHNQYILRKNKKTYKEIFNQYGDIFNQGEV